MGHIFYIHNSTPVATVVVVVLVVVFGWRLVIKTRGRAVAGGAPSLSPAHHHPPCYCPAYHHHHCHCPGCCCCCCRVVIDGSRGDGVVVAGSWWLWLIEQSTVMRHCAIAFVRVGNFTQFRLQF